MFGQIGSATVQEHARYQQASMSAFGRLVELTYGSNIYRPDDIAWSHEHCGKAYALFSFAYGLARLISMGQIVFGSEVPAERRRFVEAQARIFVLGLHATGSKLPAKKAARKAVGRKRVAAAPIAGKAGR